MRILNIMLAKVKGGVETMGLRYHEALAAEGYDVISVGHPEGMLAEGIPATQFRPLIANSTVDVLAAGALWKICHELQPDLVLTHGNRATSLCLLPFMPARDRTVQVMHNQSFRPHLKRARAALCVSANVRQALSQAYPGVRAIETANFAHLGARKVKAAPKRVPVLGALGRLHEIKGFDILLRAAADLRDAGVEFKLKIAGDGPQKDELEALCSSLNLGDRVSFVGWQVDPQAFLSGLDLFVLPSRSEAFGLVAIEAMAAGVPVVAAQSDGPRQVLDNGRFGTLTACEDPHALANAIRVIATNWAPALATAARAQMHAIRTYGFEAGRLRLRGVIESLTGTAPAAVTAGTPVRLRTAPPAGFAPVPSQAEKR